MAPPRSRRWTSEDVQHLPPSSALAQSLAKMGLGNKLDTPAAAGAADLPKEAVTKKERAKRSAGRVGDGQNTGKIKAQGAKPAGSAAGDQEGSGRARKKRQGASTAPVFASLAKASPDGMFGNNWLAISIPGGRLLTYNELYSILQFRKYEAFRYKKICQEVVAKALMVAGPGSVKRPRPFFDGPTRLTLVRIGAKEMDRDALAIVFKYLVDALKKHGVIDDDNPNIIVDIVVHQEVGSPWLGMRLDALTDWVKPHVPTWEMWKTSLDRRGSHNKRRVSASLEGGQNANNDVGKDAGQD